MKCFRKNIRTMFGSFLLFAAVLLMIPIQVHAEGTKDLVENGGYRPYTERYNISTAGQERQQVLYLEVKAGETVYFGSSVFQAVNTPGTTGNSAEPSEIHIQYPDGTDEYLNVTENGAGHIINPTQEANGPNVGTKTNGYEPLMKTASEDGTWTIEFYSTRLSGENPVKALTTDANFTANQKSGTIAAWDVSVYEGNTLKEGRLYTEELFLNMGGNNSVSGILKSIVYVRTNDGFLYQVDFNGMDPYGFVFYSNNRGLLYSAPNSTIGSESSQYSSLYHSVLTRDNQVSGLDEHNILLNNTPTDEFDVTHKIFYNIPDEDCFEVSTGVVNNDAISNFRFVGNIGDGKSYVGAGGTFIFEADRRRTSATTYQIQLSFDDPSYQPVILSNTLVQGENHIFWDGKDGAGKIVPAGTYTTAAFDLKGGEVHFPLIDVEFNRDGIKIYQMQKASANAAPTPVRTTLYYNNENDNPSRYSDGWDATVQGWTSIAGGGNYSLTGIPLEVGAEKGVMIFPSAPSSDRRVRTGDQTVLDIWTHTNASAGVNCQYEIVNDPIQLTLQGNKVLDGVVPEGFDETFSFSVKENDVEVAKGSVTNAGNIVFDPIEYTTTGTHTYTVTEIPGSQVSISYDTAPRTVEVSVTTDANGGLSAAAVYPDGAAGLTFTNVYSPESTQIHLTAKKDMTNYTLRGDDFEFQLCDSDGNVIESAVNGADGTITFSAMEFTSVGTTTYLIKEVNRTGDVHVTYDLAPRTVTVKVEDLGGYLQASVTPENITFHNVYQSTGSVVLSGYKHLDGRAMRDGEFSFALYESTESGEITNETPLQTAANDAAGNIIFAPISYESGEGLDTLEPGASKDYYYCVKEVIPGENPSNGVTYDTSAPVVKVTVTNTKTGTTEPNGGDDIYELIPTVTYPEGGLTFNNTYQPAQTTLAVPLTKELAGKDLQAEQFSFTLYEGSVNLGEAKNGADGSIIFPTITYTEAGTHQYYAKETAGDDVGYTYDASSVKVTVVVEDDGLGNLTARVQDGNAEEQIFHNSYVATRNLLIRDYQQGTDTLLEGSRYQVFEGTDTSGTALSFKYYGSREFTDANGTYTADVYRLNSPTTQARITVGDVTNTLVMGANKHIYIEGLTGLQYTIVKTASPTGYLNADDVTAKTLNFTGADGELLAEDFHERRTVATPADPTTQDPPASGTNGPKDSSGKAVNTGDTGIGMLYVILCGMALLVSIPAIRLRRRKIK